MAEGGDGPPQLSKNCYNIVYEVFNWPLLIFFDTIRIGLDKFLFRMFSLKVFYYVIKKKNLIY